MMKNLYFFSLICVLGCFNLKGQDPTFTLIDHNPLNINPAFASNSNGQVQFLSVSRQQWWNLPGPNPLAAGYHMNSASFLYPLQSKKEYGLGTGLKVDRNVAGEGSLNLTNLDTYLASRLSWRLRSRIPGTFISLPSFLRASWVNVESGISVGLKQYNLDWSQLIFSTQIDPFLGFINATPQINPRVETSNLAINSNFGCAMTFTNSNTYFKFGGGCFNWNRPGISFFDQTERIPRRLSVHGTYRVLLPPARGVTNQFKASYWMARFNSSWQGPNNTNEIRVGTNINGILTFYSGIRSIINPTLERRMDALLWSMQINTRFFMLSMGYDFTVSSLNIQRTRGTSEIGLIIPFGTRRNLIGGRKSEPCYVDYISSNSEWKAVEQFNSKSTFWGREYSPITFMK